MGSTFNKDVSIFWCLGTIFADKWTHVACSYDAEPPGLAAMYVNGEKVREWDFNLWPEGDAKRSAEGVDLCWKPCPCQ